MKPVIFHSEADAEFQAAVAWYEGKRAGLGTDLQAKVEEAVAAIQAKPARYPRHKGKDIRKCRVKRFPYTVYFLELDDTIWIAAVAHHKRRSSYWAACDPD